MGTYLCPGDPSINFSLGTVSTIGPASVLLCVRPHRTLHIDTSAESPTGQEARCQFRET